MVVKPFELIQRTHNTIRNGLQGEQIMRQPVVIALLAVPILIQVYFNAGLAYWLNRLLGVEWCVAGPSALILSLERHRQLTKVHQIYIYEANLESFHLQSAHIECHQI